MAETVISGPAQILTAFSVIVRCAGDPVLELEGGILRAVHILHPFITDVQPLLRRKTIYQYCNKK